jgi:ATP/maltotriose-dependent transcriptional regulator MalT
VRPARQLAKLTRPRLHAAMPRDRLFRRLDELRNQACVWVCGPPGCGKTILAATYLNEAHLPGIW